MDRRLVTVTVTVTGTASASHDYMRDVVSAQLSTATVDLTSGRTRVFGVLLCMCLVNAFTLGVRW